MKYFKVELMDSYRLCSSFGIMIGFLHSWCEELAKKMDKYGGC